MYWGWLIVPFRPMRTAGSSKSGRAMLCRSAPLWPESEKAHVSHRDLTLILAVTDGQCLPQPLHLPLAVKARKAGLAGQELLHGGLFEVALLGDEPIQSAQQRIHIAQCRRDGTLFGFGRRNRQWPIPEVWRLTTPSLSR